MTLGSAKIGRLLAAALWAAAGCQSGLAPDDVGEDGGSPGAGPCPTTGAPGAPTGVVAVRGNGLGTATWSAPACIGGSAIIGYTISVSPGNATATSTGPQVTVTGLTNGDTYILRVTATNAAGDGPPSAPSNEFTPMSPPDSPVDVVAQAANAAARVSWQAPSNEGSPITSYTVIAAPPDVPPVTTSATTAPVFGLTNGTSYVFEVYATSAVGNGPPAYSAPVTPAALPGAPASVSAVAGIRQATVSWSAPTDDGGSPVTGYTVTADPGGAMATTTGATSVVVSGLSNATAYTFAVIATNETGNGPPSSPSAPVTTDAVPGPPTDVTATVGIQQAIVTWTAPASDGGSAILTYTVTASPGGATVTTADETATLTGLTGGTGYSFAVYATNAVGSGPPATTTSTLVVPGPVSAAESTLVASPVSAPADGITAMTLTVTLKDAEGDGVPAQDVILGVTGVANQLLPPSGASNADGVFSARLTSTLVGDRTVSATIGATVLTAPVAFTSVACAQTLSFATALSPQGGNPARSITAGDFNEDGMLDVVVGAYLPATGAGTLQLLLGTGGGNFLTTGSPISLGGIAVSVATGDFNEDGHLDLVAVSSEGSIFVLLGDGAGGFAVHSFSLTGLDANPSAVVAADFNGDGHLDLATASSLSERVAILRGKGDGTFTDTMEETDIEGFPQSLATGDFNGDGTPDLAATTADEGTVNVLLNEHGAFTNASGSPISVTGVGSSAGLVTAADLNGDGLLDLALLATDNTLIILIGSGTGTFTIAPGAGTVGGTGGLLTGDFNADGILDLAAGQDGLLGNGSGGFTAASWDPLSAPFEAAGIALGDFNGDGRLDFAVAGTAALTVMASDCAAEAVPSAPAPASVTPGDGQVIVGWTKPTSNGGSVVTGYVVATVNDTSIQTTTWPASARSATVTGLTNGTTYDFAVYAVNAAGNGQATGAGTVTAGTPGAPTALAATVQSCSGALCTYQISWTAPASNGTGPITSYSVFAWSNSGGTTTTTAGPVTSATITLPSTDIDAMFYVYATNAIGNSPNSASTAWIEQ